MRKILFIGIVFLFLFSACPTLETPATTFASQADNPTPLPETTEVPPAATPTATLEPTLPLPTPEATLVSEFGLTIDDLTDTLFPYLTQVEGLKLAALPFDRDVALVAPLKVFENERQDYYRDFLSRIFHTWR